MFEVINSCDFVFYFKTLILIRSLQKLTQLYFDPLSVEIYKNIRSFDLKRYLLGLRKGLLGPIFCRERIFRGINSNFLSWKTIIFFFMDSYRVKLKLVKIWKESVHYKCVKIKHKVAGFSYRTDSYLPPSIVKVRPKVCATFGSIFPHL